MRSDRTGLQNEKVFKKDRYKCKNCERDGGDRGEVILHAHHIVPREVGGRDVLSNLVTLCEDCHISVHQNVTAPTVEQPEIDQFGDGSDKNVKNRTTRDGKSGGQMRFDNFDENK